MSKKDYQRVLIRHDNCLYSFINIQCSPRDGSLHVTLRRDGVSDSRTSWSNRPNDETPVETIFDTPQPKNEKITLHQSGRINFPYLRGHPIFIEPLAYISQPFTFFNYRIPSISALSKFTKIPDVDDITIDLSALPDKAQSFELFICPKEYIHGGNSVQIEYFHRYSVGISLGDTHLPINEGYDKHFITHAVGMGRFENQTIDENLSLITYHKLIQNADGPFIYAPNTDGVWQVVFNVPSRVPPSAIIEPSLPNLHVEIEDQALDKRVNQARIKFKVKDKKSGQVVKEIISFNRILISAQM